MQKNRRDSLFRPARIAAKIRDIHKRLRTIYNPILHGRVMSVEIASEVGFFAQMNFVLRVLHYCDQRRFIPQISLTGPHYRDPTRSRNWLSYFFDGAASNHTVPPQFVVYNTLELRLPDWCFADFPLSRAHELIEKYLPLKTDVVAQVNAFWRNRCQGHVLGVHFRGTDKKQEADRVAWDRVTDTVHIYGRRHQIETLLVASDEARFISHMESTFSSLRVVSHVDRFRATNDESFHATDHGMRNFAKGEDALLNCLLLARCNTVIRCTSFLSAWASIFNPTLPIVLLNAPHPGKLWYPEQLLIEQSRDTYLPSPRALRS